MNRAIFFVSWLRRSWYYANDNGATIVHGSAGGVNGAASPEGGVIAMGVRQVWDSSSKGRFDENGPSEIDDYSVNK